MTNKTDKTDFATLSRRAIMLSFAVLSLLLRPCMLVAADNLDKALACFKEGKNLYKQRQYTGASQKFREAYELKPSWKLFFNIGQSEASAKRHGLALEAFERFLSEGGDDIFVERRDAVLREVERLRKIVGFIQVQAPDGTIVTIDDVKRGKAPVSMLLPVAVGFEHVVAGVLNGQELPRRRFRITGGQTITIVLKAPPIQEEQPTGVEIIETAVDPGRAPEADDDTDESLSFQKNFPIVNTGWILSGIGAGTAVAGAVVGGMALSKNKDLVAACGDDPCPEKRNDRQSRDRLATASTALLATGGTIMAAGITLLVVGIWKQRQEPPLVSFLPGRDEKSFTASMEWSF